jgi:hypothetical protein
VVHVKKYFIMASRILIALLGFFLLGSGGYAGFSYFSKPKPQTYIVCKDDVKLCRDGIGVKRVSPSCEFPLCPEERPAGVTGGIQVLGGLSIAGPYAGTLESIRTNGGDYHCELVGEDVSGSVYVSQKVLRGDFSPVKKSENIVHLFMDEEAIRIWPEGELSGILTQKEHALGIEKGSKLVGLDLSGTFSFSCATWNRSEGALRVPGGVQFEEVKAE